MIVKDSLRIVVHMMLRCLRIAPILPKFLKNHPDIGIHLQLEEQQTSLYTDNIDVSIRIGELKDSLLIATHLGDVERVICDSPEYQSQHREPLKPTDLKYHNC